MPASACSHLSAMLYKEALLLRKNKCRLIVELAIPILLSIFYAYSFKDIPITNHPASSNLGIAYYSSSAEKTEFSKNFKRAEIANCRNKNIGIVCNNETFLQNFKDAFDIANHQYLVFPSVDKLKEWAKNPPIDDFTKKRIEICSGFLFETFGDQDYSYTIYSDKRLNPQTSQYIYDPYKWIPDRQGFVQQSEVGFYQGIADSLIAKAESNNNDAMIAYAYSPMFGKKYSNSFADDAIKPICMALAITSAVISLVFLVSRLQTEKTNKIRDYLRMMGMQDTSYYVSYFIFLIITAFFVSAAIAGGMAFAFLRNTNLLALWITCFGMILSIFPFAIIFNAIFNSPQAAKYCSILSYTALYIFLVPFTANVVSKNAKMLFSLFPPVAFSFCVDNFVNINSKGLFAFSDITTDEYNFTILEGWMLILIDFFLYLLIGLYLDNVLPGVGGIRRPWCYFMHPSYWCPGAKPQNNPNNETTQLVNNTNQPENEEIFEGVNAMLRAQEETGECMAIRDLTKKYDDGKVAVNGFSINIYKGQIFILLGHNGAGKTTALSILTGLLSPTSGEAKLLGIDMLRELDRLRGMLGICPQESIFYEAFTVEEHLKLISKIKGLDYDADKHILSEIMKKIDFLNSLTIQAQFLSGGQKRKLSLIMALIGHPQIIILDEPTSGLDASARQMVWNLLKDMKKDTILLMTTHYMDEAEQLGDRVAIMAEGQIQCCGSSLFLKSRFGTGYKLFLVKSPEGFEEEKLFAIVQKHVPNVIKVSENTTEILYRLPFSSSENFAALFTELDNSIKDFGVSSYGVGITSLEDVFLKVGEDIKKGKLEIVVKEETKFEDFSLAEKAKHSFFDNIYTVAKQVWTETLRTPRQLICEIGLPFFLIFLAVLNFSPDFSKTHTYGESIMPTPELFPLNPFSRYNESTSNFINLAQGYTAHPYEVTASPNKSIEETIYSFDEEVNKIMANQPTYGAFFISTYKRYQLQAFIQGISSCKDAPTLFGNLLSNKFLQIISGNNDASITLKIEPLDTYSETESEISKFSMIAVFLLYTIIGFAFPPGSIACTLVKERTSKLKFHKLLNGLSASEYWVGRFVGDFTKLMLPIIGIIIIKRILSVGLSYYEILLIVSVLSGLPFTYVFAYITKGEVLAFILIIVLYCFFALQAAALITIFKITYMFSKQSYMKLAIVDIVFRLLPPYNMVATLVTSVANDYMFGNQPIFTNPFDFFYLGEWIIMSAAGFIFWCLILGSIEFIGNLRQCKGIGEILQGERAQAGLKDNDVLAEEEHVAVQNASSVAVQVRRARKNFGKNRAVDDLSFGVEKGDVFALLGVNGAGKTTTFKMLTREEKPSCGKFSIHGLNVNSGHFSEIKRYIGYCPQDNIIFDNLTALEHLHYYAATKGIPRNMREQLITSLIDKLKFRENVNKAASKLSGGNKRKLCMAIALLGYPPVLLLDEPTTGLDPMNRRDLWQVISQLAKEKPDCGVVVTTHSMEEAEALATKVGIMVSGNFRCFGSVQHLKSKYGHTFELEIKLVAPKPEKLQEYINAVRPPMITVNTTQDASRLLETLGFSGAAQMLSANDVRATFLIEQLRSGFNVKSEVIVEFGIAVCNVSLIYQKAMAEFGTCFISEQTVNKVRFGILKKSEKGEIGLSKLFNFAEEIKKEGIIEEYAVYQTTLEQIFHYFARGGQIKMDS